MIPYPTTLTNNKITLRPFHRSDAGSMTQAVHESVPEVMPWMTWCHPNFSEKEALSWINSLPEAWKTGNQYAFAITNSKNGAFLGGAGFNHINPSYQLANLGYWVRTSAAGQGIATQATKLLAQFSIKKLKLLRVEIVVAVDNHASLRVAQKCGAAREGILRNRLIVHKQAFDAVMHSLTPQDFGVDL